jgi:uncharacterized membrane protein YphA (DoxX/SURF4 family)
MTTSSQWKERGTWVIQGLLAVLFLFAGGMKFVMTDQQLTEGTPAFSALFIRFIGVCEVLGALGLVLPMLLKIKPGLTPLAAAGLVIIMIGATVTVAMTQPITYAIVPVIVGALAARVAYTRWLLLANRPSSEQRYV